jgi:[NiFe] hydrogenase diaphorase moiety small subunit
VSEANFTFTIDGIEIEAAAGQTIIQACDAAGVYIPRLCYHPELEPAGHCRVCTCKIDGRRSSACTMPAAPGMAVENNTPELTADRRTLIEMLFVEGNHFCPGCEKSGNCQLQALGYEYEMANPHFVHLFPDLGVDASHPDVLIDRNRCVQCELCVRASRDVDGKDVFALGGRGLEAKLIINSPSGQLVDSDFAVTDRAAHVCPVGAILIKRVGFAEPIGERAYDLAPISAEAMICEIPESAS